MKAYVLVDADMHTPGDNRTYSKGREYELVREDTAKRGFIVWRNLKEAQADPLSKKMFVHEVEVVGAKVVWDGKHFRTNKIIIGDRVAAAPGAEKNHQWKKSRREIELER